MTEEILENNPVKIVAGQVIEQQEQSQSVTIPSQNTPRPPSRLKKLAPDTIYSEKFKIIGMIGHGGMSVVYEVEHLVLKKRMALKLIDPNQELDDSHIQRFKQEAQSVCELNHPGIVRLYDFGVTTEGEPYLATELCEGKPLSSLIESCGHLSVKRALDLIIPVCMAMQHSHDHNIIHRDLKPDNLIVGTTPEGREAALVIDFGIAKVTSMNDGRTLQRLTSTGEVVGTPTYMSPEQCLGHEVDPRSDVYSLACVLFEALTGKAPFGGNTLYAAIKAQVEDAPPVMSSINPDFPKDSAIEAVILQALAKDPDDRFQSMQEFASALQDAYNNKFSWSAQLRTNAQRKKAGTSDKPSWAGRLPITLTFLILLLLTGWAFTELKLEAPSGPKSAEQQWTELNASGQHLLNDGHYNEALARFEQAAALAQSFNNDADRTLWKPRYQLALEKQAVAEILADHTAPATKHIQEAATAQREISERPMLEEKALLELWRRYKPDNSESFKSLVSKITALCHRYTDELRIQESKNLLQEALAKTTGDPNNSSLTANILHEQGRVFNRLSKFTEAARALRQALPLREQTYGERSMEVANTMFNLSFAEAGLKNLKEAEQLYERAAELCQVNTGEEAAKGRAYSFSAKGSLELHAGHYDQAIDMFKKAIAAQTKRGDFKSVRESSGQILWMYQQQHKSKEAIKFLLDQLAQSTRERNAESDIAFYNEQLGDLYNQTGNYAEAARHFKTALFYAQLNNSPLDDGLMQLRDKYARVELTNQHMNEMQAIVKQNAAVSILKQRAELPENTDVESTK